MTPQISAILRLTGVFTTKLEVRSLMMEIIRSYTDKELKL
jgi:hypothetical protein